MNVVIDSEEKLFETLEEYLSTGIISNNIDMTSLPDFEIRIVGDKFDQSLTPAVMKGFVEMQNYINRTYCLAKYGNVDTKQLSKEEREALQLKITVKKGSSLVNVSFEGLWTQIGQLATKMDATTISLTILGGAAIWATSSAVKRFLDNRKEVRLAEIKNEEEKKNLQVFEVMSQEETKRTEIIANLIKQTPLLENIDRQAHDAKTSMFKALNTAKEVEIADISLTPDLTTSLTKNARRRSSEIRLDDVYKLEQVNSSDPDLFKVKVRNIKTDECFDAIAQDQFLTGNKNKILLMQAEWGRKPIYLSINAKVLDEKIKDAFILDVKEIT